MIPFTVSGEKELGYGLTVSRFVVIIALRRKDKENLKFY